MNAIHVGDDEVIGRRNTKMRIIRKSKLDGTTYFDVDVEPQTKEEIDARIQGRVAKPEDAPSSSELPTNDGGGADGLGNGGPLPINYSPKPTGQGPEQAPRLGFPREDIFQRIIKDTVPPERIPEEINDLAATLKDNVAKSVSEKITGVSNDEFINLAISQRDYKAENFNWQGKVDIEQTNLFVKQKESGLVRNYNYSIGEFVRILGASPEVDKKDKEFIKQATRGGVTFEDAQKIVDLFNVYLEDKNMSPGTILLGDKNNEDIMKLIRYRSTSHLVRSWATSSNGDNSVSLAIQDLALKEFDIDRPAEWTVNDELKNEISQIKNHHENVIRRFLRAQYDLTQEYFQKKGISKITLYRGVRDFTAHSLEQSTFPNENGFTATIKLRPLSSWTTSFGTASGFGRMSAAEAAGLDENGKIIYRDTGGKVFRKEYDTKDILGFPGTGVGCLNEEEFVVLGGVTKNVDVSGSRDPETKMVKLPTPNPKPITYKDAPLTPNLMLNNAPRDFRDLTSDERAKISKHNPNVNIWEQIAEESTFYKKEIPSTLVNVLEQDKQAVRENRPPGDQPGQEATIGLGRALKSGVAKNIAEKLEDVDINEFIKLAVDKGTFSDEFDWSEPKDIDKVILFSSRGGDVNPYSFTLDKIISQSGPDIKDLVERIKARGGKVTFDEAKDLLEMINLRQRQIDPLKEYHIADINDAEIADHLRYQISSDLIKNWAITSNGNDFVSLAMQDVAKKEFGISAAANWQIDPENQKKIDKIVKNNGNLLGRFLRAQYDATQEYFNRKGITKVTLYRGVKKFANHEIVESTFPNGGRFTATLGLRPLSAWSTSRRVAEVFASAFEQSRLFRKEFDVKDILCFPGTGFGCLDEKEMVVIGGNTKNIDVSGQRNLRPMIGTNQAFSFEKEPENYQIVFKDDKKNPLEEMTEAGAPIKNWVNYAPIDLSKIPPDDGGEEPELDIFELEGVDVYRPEIYKAEVAQAIAESDEMLRVDDSQFVSMGAWSQTIPDESTIEWDTPTKDINNIYLASTKSNGKLDEFVELTDVLYFEQESGEPDDNWGYKKGGVGAKILNAYGTGKRIEISKKELTEFIKEYNKKNGYEPSESYFVPDTSDEQFMSLYREEVVSNLVHQWAQTSNDDHPISQAIQEVAKELFDIKDSADWDAFEKVNGRAESVARRVKELKEKEGDILKAFVQAQYRLTQEWFEERGIKKITVYRGIKNARTTVPGSGEAKLRPLSSWSTNLSTAHDFTRGNAGDPLAKSMLLRREVDVEEIFSTPLTGVGCIEEYEVVLLGGKKTVDSASPEDRSIRMGVWPKAQGVTVNNAPISNAPKKMSNTERKRLEREKRKAEEAAAPSPEQVKEEMQQAQQGVAEVAQVLPETLDTFFDPNNPLNILNARNITNDITGTNINRDNLSKDDLLQQRLLFMEPTKEWYDLLDKIEQSGEPFAKEIISRIKKKHAKLIERIQKKTLEERQAQIEQDNAANDILNVVNTLVNNALTRPSDVPGLNSSTPVLLRYLDEYFGGNPTNMALADSDTISVMAIMNLYTTNNPNVALANPQYDPSDVRKVVADLVNQFSAAYARYGNSSATPDRNALTKEIQKIYVRNFFGGVNPTDIQNTTRVMARLSHETSLRSLFPLDIVNILSDKSNTYEKKRKILRVKKVEVVTERQELATKLAQTTKEVLSENGLEFDHGVKISPQDVNWSGVHEFEFALNAQNEYEFRPTQMPDYMKANLAPELRNTNGALNILNEALQAYPKPVALALRNFLIDNKSSFSFFSTSRGVTAILNPKELQKVHDIGDLSGVINKLGISGSSKETAVETTVHELLHLIVNGIFRNQMNAIAWAKQSRETNNVAPDGRIFHNFVDGNYGDIAYPPTGNYLDSDDIIRMIQANELGASSPNFATPYIGKYGVAAGAQAAIGQNPFAHGELLSSLFESLLGGGLTGMFNTAANPKKVLSGVNPDGTPKYTTMDDSVFSEKMLPFGVSMIVLLNELAKLKLGIA